jgi:hypothetical protein
MPPIPIPVAAPPGPAQATRTFSEHAEKRMWDLKKDYATQVGSHYGGADGVGKTKTDCITYVMNVLTYAFEKTGKPEYAAGVRANASKGTDLGHYLVGRGWKAYYWNPDVKNPRDGVSEHPFAYKSTSRSGIYYSVPVSGYIIDYNLTPVTVAPPPGFLDRLLGAKAPPPPRINDMTAFDAFSKVKFSYGLAKGGVHTFLLSYGMVFEVHWGACGPGLYGVSPFYTYAYLDGLVITPPDSGFSLL